MDSKKYREKPRAAVFYPIMARQLDVINVIDVESTCWEGEPPPGEVSEIIQIGICTVDVTSVRRVEKRSVLVKPVKSTFSAFCTQLTGLRPDMYTEAVSLAEAVRILKTEYNSHERLWASWGDYDRRQFERVCKLHGVGYPFGISHLNVKTLFAVARAEAHESGVDAAFQKLGMVMEGRHHRGDDDAWNIAALLCRLLQAMRNGGSPS